LRTETIGFVMSVRPSAWKNSAPTGRIFMKFDIWECLENLSRKFKFHENRTRIKGTLREDQYIFLLYLAYFFLEWEMFQVKIVEKIKIHILCSVTFFEHRAVYKKRWKNIVERGRPQMTIWRMSIACWIPKATKHTLTICNTNCFSTATMVAKRASVLHYTSIASLV
jgi:hypothetical protein